MKKIFSLFAIVLVTSCGNKKSPTETQTFVTPPRPEVPTLRYTIVKTFPHDTTSYTQGLLVHNKKFYESTGSPDQLKYTRSVVGLLDTATGKINVKAELDKNKFFGEGIAIIHGKIFQLTWQSQTGFIYDEKTFKRLGEFKFENKEGWGLTTDGTHLILSDGTHILTYINPVSLTPFKSIEVMNNGYPEMLLNELEYIDGFIYANVYQRNYIVKIDPSNGNVVGILDLSPLSYTARSKHKNAEVLNGIAYDPDSKRLFVTGKLWPEVYEIKLDE